MLQHVAEDFDDRRLNPSALFHASEEFEKWLVVEGLPCPRSGARIARMMLGFLTER